MVFPTGQSDCSCGHPPKLLFVTGSLEAGGAERALTTMANYWAGKGWNVTVATWSGPESQDFYHLVSSVDRVWLQSTSSRTLPFRQLRSNIARVLKLRGVLRSAKPTVVVSFIDVSNVLTIVAAMGLKLRVVVSERGSPDQVEEGSDLSWTYSLSRHWRTLRKYVYSRADVVTALNINAAKWLERECNVEVKLIPVALRKLPELDVTREELVLAVGRLHPVKGFDILLKAFAEISVRFPSWSMVVLGEGPERAALEELCWELQLADRVAFIGSVAEVEQWMARAGVVVLPSRFEAFGNAALESLGMGAAVIATDSPGPSSYIKNNVNGRLVPVGNVGRLAKAMAELMGDPALRRRLGQEAKKVRQEYKCETVMRQWEECFLPGCRNFTQIR